jgi:hypothetical protein
MFQRMAEEHGQGADARFVLRYDEGLAHRCVLDNLLLSGLRLCHQQCLFAKRGRPCAHMHWSTTTALWLLGIKPDAAARSGPQLTCMLCAAVVGFPPRRIYAAADLILIPSFFEPCGLTQLIALRYGTIPIVNSTGGLADTVFDVSNTSVPEGERNGFVFR